MTPAIKRTILILAFLTFSMSIYAETLRTYDLNHDGIIDRFEYIETQKVIRIEEDRNGDKKIDFKIILTDKTFYKIEWQDTNFDEKFDRKKSYLLLPQSKTRILTEIDKNSDGKFESSYEEVLDNIQQQYTCESTVDLKIKALSEAALLVASKTEQGLLLTGTGYKVDQECYKKWGADLNQTLKDVSVGGLQCLKDLDTKGRKDSKISGALRNALNLTKLMDNDGISLICSEDKDYEWNGVMAHASTTLDQKMTSKSITHPFISINPNQPDKSAISRIEKVAQFKVTLFHETLHNLGYRHDEDIEFSYTCGQCCFGEDTQAAVKAQACKICLGNYTNETDLAYIEDIVEYSQLTFQSDIGAVAVKKFLKENSKSTTGISMLAYAESGVFNPVGSELAKIISKNHSNLTLTEKKYLTDSQLYAGSDEFKSAQVTSKVLANSLYELYFNKSAAKATASIDTDKVLIKRELNALKQSSETKKYVHDYLRRVLDNLIYDMWVNNYSGDEASERESSTKSYELFLFFQVSP